MSERNAMDTYIPYLATAEAITAGDDSPELFLRSLFPGATDEQIASMRLYTTGKILDGIHYGLALSSEDPIGSLEAYRMGEIDGFERAQAELNRRGEE